MTRPVRHHFRTEHLKADLTGRSVRGGAVTLGSHAVVFVLHTGSTMILARLLSPADFGLVAMVSVFAGIIGLFRNMGLSTATIQQAEITQDQVSTLFWINGALGMALMLCGAAMSPLVAWIYGDPRLVWIMLVVSVTFGVGGLAAQHKALLRRQMRYYALGLIEVVTLAAAITAALLVAWAGGGYWALVMMPVVGSLVDAGMAWLLSGWRPGPFRRSAGVSSMVKFGGNLTIFNVTNYFTRNADNALIGWSCGAGPLGLYSRAYSLLMLPMNQINAPLAGVVLPGLSRLQSDPARYSRYYCRIVNLVHYATMPMLALLAALTHELIEVVLGRQWTGAGPIFTVLAVSAIGQPLSWSTSWVLLSRGRADRQRNWGLISDPLFVVSFIIGLPWGPIGVATAYAVCVNLLVLPCVLYALHDSPVRLRDLLAAIWCPFLFSGAVFGGALLGSRLTSPAGGDLIRIVCGGLGALFAALLFAGAVRPCRTELLALATLVRHLKKQDS